MAESEEKLKSLLMKVKRRVKKLAEAQHSEILRRGGKNTQKNCRKKIFTTQIIMMM